MNTTIAAPSQMSRHCRVATSLAFVVAMILELSACNRRSPKRSGAESPLPSEDTIAVVGNRVFSRGPFMVLAAKSGMSADDFVRGWGVDAALAQGARAGALDVGRVRQVERAVLARAVLEIFRKRALDQGPPSSKELQDMRAERWFQVDRPPAVQVAHFVVVTKQGRTQAGAESLAHKIADAVRHIKVAQDFKKAVNDFPRGDAEVVAESLPPITADGRSLRLDTSGKVLGAGPAFDAVFAQAANAIEREGEQSAVVHTRFGYHVILLERRLASEHSTIESQRELYASEIMSRRARRLADRSIQDSRRHQSVRVESSFQEVIAQAQVLR